MSEELLSWCQTLVEKLSKQKDDLLQNSKNEKPKECNLPHYKTMLEVYKSIEEKELFLLEINQRIKETERENDIKQIKSSFSSFRLCESVAVERQTSYIQEWLHQILMHNKSLKTETELSENVMFYDVDFVKSNGKESLTWSTRYKGRCLRVCVNASSSCQITDLESYDFSASFYVTGLVEEGKRIITSAENVTEYVKLLWSGLQELIDIF
ncbi:uncharacterized protein LOC120338782 [Styela clava]